MEGDQIAGRDDARRQPGSVRQAGTPSVNQLFRQGRRKQSAAHGVDNSSATGVFGAEEAVGWAVSRQ